ncbi:hypothetical protein FRUB_09156 [Fimbriiglobus ruber]|uniref:Uncharacterized protein n=2 Tax=Fimbriiglobus ruber TaxID=1908690 RepID=A0A225D6I3_9BACT|nr:hypothetical protein FRUB_09156 [Fimbriiglobus ruber]
MASLSVPELLAPVLDALARTGSAHLPPQAINHEEWLRRANEWQQLVENRADRYPPGFRVDDDRESIYKDREDAQR